MRRSDRGASDDLAVLRAISADLLAGGRIAEVAEKALADFAAALDIAAAAVFLTPPRGVDAPTVLAAAGADVDTLQPTAGEIFSSSDSRPAVTFGAAGAVMGVPLVFQDSPVGALVASRPHQFGDRDVAFAEVVGAQLALAIERHRAGELLDRQLAEVTLRQVQLEADAVGIAAERDRAEKLAGQLRDLNATYVATVRSLAIAIETKDENTSGHLERVTRYGLAMLRTLAPDARNNKQFEYGFLLHDIGMLAVPDAVLRKPGELSEQDWELLRGHPAVGYRMLDGIPYLTQAKEIVLAHHERWDGRGYPLGIGGIDIPLGARIFPLADAFEAMTSNRPYRTAMSIDDALAELRRGARRQFWPDAVEAFCAIPAEELADIQSFTGASFADDDDEE